MVTFTQELAEIYGTDRKSGKGVTYCLIYGGGNQKLGLTAGATKSGAARKGAEIRKRIMEGLPGFADLSSAIAKRAEGDVLKGPRWAPDQVAGQASRRTELLAPIRRSRYLQALGHPHSRVAAGGGYRLLPVGLCAR